MKKSETRLAYNFLRSYYEVFKKLPDDASKVAYITAICEMQFHGVKIDLEGIADLAYTSQEFHIKQSREGWESVQKRENIVTPSVPPSVGGSVPPSVQEKEKEEEKGKEESNTRPLKESIDYDALLKFINNRTNRKYQLINEGVRRKFEARLREGYEKTHIFNAVQNAVKVQVHKDNGFQYLTPDFFSRSTTLDTYGHDVGIEQSQESFDYDKELSRRKKEQGYAEY